MEHETFRETIRTSPVLTEPVRAFLIEHVDEMDAAARDRVAATLLKYEEDVKGAAEECITSLRP